MSTPKLAYVAEGREARDSTEDLALFDSRSVGHSSIACDGCRKRKMRCTSDPNGLQCSNCARYQIDCTYSGVDRRRPWRRRPGQSAPDSSTLIYLQQLDAASPSQVHEGYAAGPSSPARSSPPAVEQPLASPPTFVPTVRQLEEGNSSDHNDRTAVPRQDEGGISDPSQTDTEVSILETRREASALGPIMITNRLLHSTADCLCTIEGMRYFTQWCNEVRGAMGAVGMLMLLGMGWYVLIRRAAMTDTASTPASIEE